MFVFLVLVPTTSSLCRCLCTSMCVFVRCAIGANYLKLVHVTMSARVCSVSQTKVLDRSLPLPLLSPNISPVNTFLHKAVEPFCQIPRTGTKGEGCGRSTMCMCISLNRMCMRVLLKKMCMRMCICMFWCSFCADFLKFMVRCSCCMTTVSSLLRGVHVCMLVRFILESSVTSC